MKLTALHKDHFIRYRTHDPFTRRRRDRTTLIIGAVCKEGIVLVGDTKVVDTGKNTSYHENKILTPFDDKAVAVGAAGLTDVFKRFNRRIPVVFDRREKEIKIENEMQLRKVGLSLTDFEAPPVQASQGSADIPEVKNEKKEQSIQIPYTYTGEDFLDDCKTTIREVTEVERSQYPNPLDVLLAFYAGKASLYQINSYGSETEITDYTAIGSGSVYVDMFFQKLWKEKTYAETIALASFVIKFIQNMELDNFVGIDKGKLPQVVVIPNNDYWGLLEFSNHEEFLDEAERYTARISDLIGSIKLPKLHLDQGYKLDNY